MNSSPTAETSKALKNCPYCGRQIASDWLLCPYCGRDLSAPFPDTPRARADIKDQAVPAPRFQKPGFINKRILFYIGLPVFILVCVYFVVAFLLTQQINNMYYSRNCAGVVTSENAYSPLLLPGRNALQAELNECRSYLAAEAAYAKRSWQNAYEGYAGYISQYPQGILLNDSSAKAAEALYAWAQEERAAGQFDSAIKNLDTLTGTFPSSAKAANAASDIPQVYLEWGKALEAGGDFANAETEFKSVFQTDPNSQVAGSSSNQLQAILPDFYKNWAANLISQGKYEEAVLHYQSALDLVSGENLQTIRDGLANTQAKWALYFSSTGDFTRALIKIADARSASTSTAAQNESESGYQSILTDFSNSTGAEAAQALNQAATDVCASGKLSESDLPIFGIDPDQKDVYLLGDSISTDGLNDLAAKSPASMHYVACITVTTSTIQSCPYTEGYTLDRDLTYWEIKLYNIVSGKYLASTKLAGGYPPSCPPNYFFTRGQYVSTSVGSAPAYDDLKAWLLPRITR